MRIRPVETSRGRTARLRGNMQVLAGKAARAFLFHSLSLSLSFSPWVGTQESL